MKKLILILTVFLLSIYGFLIEPNMLHVEHYQIKDKSLAGLKVVFVGDWHIKPSQEKRLQKVVKVINEQNPDLVLSVGDYISGHNSSMTMPMEQITVNLKQIHSTYGFYTVLGNHDWWADGVGITKQLEKNGIKVLANSNTKIKIRDKTIYIAGVEDLTTRNPNLLLALDNVKQPTILLTHSPDIIKGVPKSVNLTLAGHVHGGQVRLPFVGAIIIPSKYGDRYSHGLIEENGKKMIVTKGIGNSILPIRLNCVPEIVVIEFE